MGAEDNDAFGFVLLEQGRAKIPEKCSERAGGSYVGTHGAIRPRVRF